MHDLCWHHHANRQSWNLHSAPASWMDAACMLNGPHLLSTASFVHEEFVAVVKRLVLDRTKKGQRTGRWGTRNIKRNKRQLQKRQSKSI